MWEKFPQKYPEDDKENKENSVIEFIKKINPKRMELFYNTIDKIKEMPLDEAKAKLEESMKDLESLRYTLYDIRTKLKFDTLSEEKTNELETQKGVIIKSINQKKEEIIMLEYHIKTLEEKKVSETTEKKLDQLYTDTQHLHINKNSNNIV